MTIDGQGRELDRGPRPADRWDGRRWLALALAMRRDRQDERSQAYSFWIEGWAQSLLGREDSALACYDAAISGFIDGRTLEARMYAGRAMLYKADLLARRGEEDEALALYDSLDARFGQSADVELGECAAEALVEKAAILASRGLDVEAIALCEATVDRFGDGGTEGLRVPVAKALVNKGASLGRLGRADEALASYRAMLARLQEDDAEEMIRQADMARRNIALLGRG